MRCIIMGLMGDGFLHDGDVANKRLDLLSRAAMASSHRKLPGCKIPGGVPTEFATMSSLLEL